MKKVLAVIFSLLFFAALSFAVVGCKKAEEQKPAEAPKAEAPAYRSSGALHQRPRACSTGHQVVDSQAPREKNRPNVS